ncbi:MFS transporter [Jidongwangia harbinensis]|uniref:MFS transporter n=1 Tax=Jidongwangia harbinensis TaxID=2878561 RepID=UPI001CD948D1|nr:MFS transporter [Jidongwangia harbinensis]MCA2212847.1 MFS transporter [Jidongwangia harbinensis]
MVVRTVGRGTGRTLLPLGLMFLAVGISSALMLPFLALFLSTEVGAGPVRVTVFLIAAPLSGVVASSLVARLSDRRAIRRRLLIGAALAGFAGCLATAFVRDYWILLGLAVTGLAVAGALYPQTFAFARQVLLRDNPGGAAMAISSLRTVFSVAWVGGPPLAAVLLQTGGFRYVYGAAALMYLAAAAVATFRLVEPPAIGAAPVEGTTPAPVPAGPDASRATLLLAAAGFTLLQCPLTLGAQALSLYTSNDLGGDVSDAGLILGLCAALEIPLMLGLGWLSTRLKLRSLILGGAAVGAAYYALATAAGAVWVLLVGQLLHALFIAAVSGLGISYVQEMLPRQPGRATTLFTNTFPIGAMLAGPLLGVAQLFGYRLAYAMGTALCVAGLILLVAARPPRPDHQVG